MTTLQIIALSLIGAGIIIAVAYFIAFIVEINKSEKQPEVETPVVDPEEVGQKEVVEIDIDEMLAKLEENSNKKVVENTAVEVEEEPIPDSVLEPEVAQETEVQEIHEEVVETIEEPVEEIVEEVKTEEPVEVSQVEEKEEKKTTVIIKKIAINSLCFLYT